MFLSKFEVVWGCVWKITPEPKNAGNFMKWINPQKKFFFTVVAHLDLENFLVKVWGGGGGGVKNHTWTKNAGNFMKWINPHKKIFSLFGPFGVRKFSHQSLRWWWGCVRNHTWTKNAGNFMKWINPQKIFFHCLAHLELENFLIKVWGGGGGVGVSGARPPHHHHYHPLNSTQLFWT